MLYQRVLTVSSTKQLTEATFEPSSTGCQTVPCINIRHLESHSFERLTMPKTSVRATDSEEWPGGKKLNSVD